MNDNIPHFEVTPLYTAKDRFLKLLNARGFMQWAALTGIVIGVLGLITAFIALRQIKNVGRVAFVHDQVLEKIVKGELPLLQLEDKNFVPALPYTIKTIHELKVVDEQLRERLGIKTPIPVPTPPIKFEIQQQ